LFGDWIKRLKTHPEYSTTLNEEDRRVLLAKVKKKKKIMNTVNLARTRLASLMSIEPALITGTDEERLTDENICDYKDDLRSLLSCIGFIHSHTAELSMIGNNNITNIVIKLSKIMQHIDSVMGYLSRRILHKYSLDYVITNTPTVLQEVETLMGTL
jgi:hypothetical protein